MKILFFSHYFPPEVNAPASRTYEHCVRWVRAGHDVTVVTCVPNCPEGTPYNGYRNRWRPQIENVDGIRVIRVWTYLAANAGTLRRSLNFVSYMFSALLATLFRQRPDVIVATSPQFFCGWAGVLASWCKRAPLVLEIRDIWPESIEAVGAMRNQPLLRLLQWLECRMYIAANHIVAVGNGYRDNILQKASVAKRISVITNGVDLKRFAPMDPDPDFLRRWNLTGKFVCSYIGTIGMAHGLEVVVKAAKQLREQGRNDIVFCLVGDGAHAKYLKELVVKEKLENNIIFTGRRPKEEMPSILASSDACLVHLKGTELFGTVIPSKIFETLAMGRPIIMGVRGEAREIVLEAEAGIEMEPDSPESLAKAVRTLADQPDLTHRLGHSARRYVAQQYDRSRLAGRYLQLLASVASRGACQVTGEHAPHHSASYYPVMPDTTLKDL